MNPKGLRGFQLVILALVTAFLLILVAMRVDVMYSDGQQGGLDRLQQEVKIGIGNLFGTNKQSTGAKHVNEVGSCHPGELCSQQGWQECHYCESGGIKYYCQHGVMMEQKLNWNPTCWGEKDDCGGVCGDGTVCENNMCVLDTRK